MDNATFDKLYPTYQPVIRAVAVALAKSNRDLADDLEQEGLITFWKLDLSKAKTNQKAFVRSAVRNRMVDYLRKQHMYETESLDAMTNSTTGQVTIDAVTGEARLIKLSKAERQAEQEEREERWGDRASKLVEGD